MTYDAVVVGAGPNGLAAAIELQRNGCSTLLVEAAETVGGAARTEEVTLPGFLHDVGSAVHPLGVGSPFFSSLPLESFGVEWVHPDAPQAHPLLGERAAILERDIEQTAASLEDDGAAWIRRFGLFVEHWDTFITHLLARPCRHRGLHSSWRVWHPSRFARRQESRTHFDTTRLEPFCPGTRHMPEHPLRTH